MLNVAAQRKGASVNAYLILLRGSEVLLSLRQNTGYGDGLYGLVSGHVEDGESATSGMIREAQEESGVIIDPAHLQVVHVMHRQTTRFNVDFFFACSRWEGSITNAEPGKCKELRFFPIDQIPGNTLPYVAYALQAFQKGTLYSEEGWL